MLRQGVDRSVGAGEEVEEKICCVKVWTGMWGLGAQQHCLRTYVELCIHPPTPSHNPPPILTHILPLCAGAGDGSAVAAPGGGDRVLRRCSSSPPPLPPPPNQPALVYILSPCALTGDGSAVSAPGGSHRVLGRRDEQPVPTPPTHTFRRSVRAHNSSCPRNCPPVLLKVTGVQSLRLVVETEFSGGARAVWVDPHLVLAPLPRSWPPLGDTAKVSTASSCF